MRTTEASVKGRVPVSAFSGEMLARKPAARQFLAHLGAYHLVFFRGKIVVIHGGCNIPHFPAHFHQHVAEYTGRKTFFTLAKQARVVVSS